ASPSLRHARVSKHSQRDELNCSICLNIYTDPITLGCGHSFCKLCIGNELDKEKESGIYSCPECRAEYRKRPKLQRNMTLCNIVERCRSTQPGENVTGITSSLCEAHLKVHSQSAQHVLTEATTSLDHWKFQGLTKHEKEVREKADHMKQRVTDLIMDTRKKLKALEKKVLLEISMQEEQVSLRISDLIEQLDKKISELSKEVGHIEELQNMTDPLAVLPVKESYIAGCGDALKEGQKYDLRTEEISSTLQTGLSGIIDGLKRKHDVIKITKTLLDVNTSPDILLDVNTASKELIVSSDLKTVSWTQQSQNRPETPERFEFYPQVLSIGGFTSGRHYWEVETSGDGWIIGMAYPSIDRKGRQSYSNYNAIDPHNYRGHISAGIQLGEKSPQSLPAYHYADRPDLTRRDAAGHVTAGVWLNGVLWTPSSGCSRLRSALPRAYRGVARATKACSIFCACIVIPC
uniref:Uncharacterized protein n=1 Tax=Leptobrachium leishanense TaxID=445787 RepID=A0A8C5QYB4_9ANUR